MQLALVHGGNAVEAPQLGVRNGRRREGGSEVALVVDRRAPQAHCCDLPGKRTGPRLLV